MNAFGIFSGGLDSLLAAKLMIDQGLNVTLLTFTSPFFSPEKALNTSKNLNTAPVLIDITEDMRPLLTKPAHGHGRWLNPCIDCHMLMIRKAGEFLLATGEPGLIFSGEVLGQRPMSQNSGALKIVAEGSGFSEFLLRPLSALSLKPTKMELDGVVKREKLLKFTGRSRQPQIALAAQYGFTDYPNPGGGCLLTDSGYSRRLKWLMKKSEQYGAEILSRRNMEFLKFGRLFDTQSENFVVVGRNEKENLALANLAREGDLMLTVALGPGPTVIIPDWNQNKDLYQLAAELCAAYTAKPGDWSPKLIRVLNRPEMAEAVINVLNREQFLSFMI